MAEGVGFEPTTRLWRVHALQACALDHSATPPTAGDETVSEAARKGNYAAAPEEEPCA